MRRITSTFGLIALAPAALAFTPANASPVLHLTICAGTDAARTITVPLPMRPGGGETPCCVKGCHTGSNRKRSAR